MQGTKLIACDLEGAGLDARYNPEVPLWYGHLYGQGVDYGTTNFKELTEYMDFLQAYDEITFIFHNAAFDVACFRCRGYDIPRYTDTMGMRYCIEPNARKSLDETAWDYLGERKKEKPSFDYYSDEMAEYCRQDTVLTYKLFHELDKELRKDADAYNFWMTIELPYIECIIEMQSNGAVVDNDILDVEKKDVELRLKEIKKDINKLVRRKPVGLQGIPEAFNPRSGRDKANALIKIYGWKPKKFSEKSGEPVVDKHVLNELKDQYPLANHLVEYNKWYKYLSATILPMKDKQWNGRVYGSFNQFSVRTGRLSCSEPNLQQIPARDERGERIRACYVAPDGYDVVVGDLDRIELVVLAFYLECILSESLLAGQIRNGIDVHSENASRWHNVSKDVERFKQLHRSPCKNGVFALNYGAGISKFAATISVSKDRAKELMESDPLLAPVAELRRYVIKKARQNDGVIHNFFGRRLAVPELFSDDRKEVAAGERRVFNYLIQGTAGDIFKYLQLKAKKELYDAVSYAKQILVVHDEAMYYIDSSWSQGTAELLSQCYSDKELLTAGDVNLPISCEFHVGKNWWLAKGE